MPAVIGGVRLINVSTGGQFQMGDAAAIVPKTESKTYAGAGTFSTGDVPRSFNVLNSTNSNDQDASDANIVTAL